MELTLLEIINIRAQLDLAYWRNIQQHNDTVTKKQVRSIKTSKERQNDLLDCILEVCHEGIIKQINRASYLAIIADETTDILG
ncbi:unnamed protein product [Acanthoscelides obtectus]|uniref:DUF4371 domain-containing protein n=1 Tax=Acanthoscelides obtectus TaxID=200917 RepID=A0A9P0JNI2_ACAOB|nr:unnamed protein product [Acanthoscelides obtectus]CAK1654386.1 hypothetical protein AOBTE_LOCUS18555 [Acanthoscelides obtectus]